MYNMSFTLWLSVCIVFFAVQKRCLPTSDAINNLGDEFQNIINSTDIISAIQNIKLLAQAQEVLFMFCVVFYLFCWFL